jgi:hypothetical protein
MAFFDWKPDVINNKLRGRKKPWALLVTGSGARGFEGDRFASRRKDRDSATILYFPEPGIYLTNLVAPESPHDHGDVYLLTGNQEMINIANQLPHIAEIMCDHNCNYEAAWLILYWLAVDIRAQHEERTALSPAE